jgi:hypothetical protein
MVRENIINLLNTLERPGKEKIIEYLEGSTFFTDPASCSEYNAYDGGLAEHSFNVYQILERNCTLHPELKNIQESIKIVGLLHDVCHIGTFQKVSKNVTVQGPDGRNRVKENGKLLFIEKDGYDLHIEAQLPYPRGTLSTMLIKQHLKLNKLEDLAIQWHAGVYDQPQHLWEILKRAQKIHKLIFLLFSAKREAVLYHDRKVEG